MKKLLFAFFLCIICLSGCTSAVGMDRSPHLLEFEGIPWNATPEEVISAIQLSESDCTTAEENRNSYFSYLIRVDDYLLWGEYPVSMCFSFVSWDITVPHYGLEGIQIFFPNDTDCEQLKERLKQYYGSPTNSYTTYYWTLDGVEEMTETCDEPQLAWISNETFASVLTDVAIDKFYENVCLRQSSPFSEQDFEFFLKNPATILTWTEDAFENLVTPPSGMTRNFLEYDASALVMLLQRFSDTNE